MKRGWRALVAVVAMGMAATLTWSAERVTAATGDSAKSEPPGNIILLRGLANVFSLGMDDLGKKLRAEGVKVTVKNHAAWMALASEVETDYAADKGSALPVVIMGHSYGANAALLMADKLGQDNIPVALVVLFDATTDIPIPANVRHVLNFYWPQGVGRELRPARGFRGKLENIDVGQLKLGVDHLNIEKSAALHDKVIPEVVQLVRRR